MQTTEEIESYLGLPMMGGRNKKVLFRTIQDRIWCQLHSWRANFFSQAGREILLKAVIQAMPTYFMSCFRIPEGQCQEIEKLMACYWWGLVQVKKNPLESMEEDVYSKKPKRNRVHKFCSL